MLIYQVANMSQGRTVNQERCCVPLVTGILAAQTLSRVETPFLQWTTGIQEKRDYFCKWHPGLFPLTYNASSYHELKGFHIMATRSCVLAYLGIHYEVQNCAKEVFSKT